MAYTLKKTVALVGMMGSGKTAIGTAVAKKLGVAFKDSDHAIEQAANMSVSEIFERDGEAFFRQKETQVLGRLLKDECVILSTGGGAYLAPRNREMIHESGVAVWLRASTELLWNRVKHKNTRPLLRTDNPHQTLVDLCISREPSYAKAELIVDADASYSIDDMANKVVEALLSRPDVLEREG